MHAQLYYSDLIQQCPQYPILLPLLSLFIYTTPPRLPPLPLFLLSFALRTHSHPRRTCSTMDIKSDLLSSNRIVSDPRKCCQTNPPEYPPVPLPRSFVFFVCPERPSPQLLYLLLYCIMMSKICKNSQCDDDVLLKV